MEYHYEAIDLDISPDPGQGLYFTWMPHVPTTIYGPRKSRPVIALIDSGAVFCVAPMALAKSIGVKPDRKRGVKMKGIGRDVSTVYPATIGVQLDGLDRVELPVYFGEKINFSALVLGQRDFFDRFNVCFKKNEEKFEITPVRRRHV